MENQHRLIVGFRELNARELELMNEIKAKAADVGALIERIQNLPVSAAVPVESAAVDPRWASIAKTQLQQGFMALTRAIARPDFF